MSDPRIQTFLSAMAAFPAELHQTFAQQPEAAIRFRPGPDEWSAIEVVGHLIDAEEILLRRMGQMISADNPQLIPLDQVGLVRQRDYQHKQLSLLLVSFAEKRAATVEELRYLRADNLERGGVHPWRGPITIGNLLTIWPGHDQQHLAQIKQSLAMFAGQ